MPANSRWDLIRDSKR